MPKVGAVIAALLVLGVLLTASTVFADGAIVRQSSPLRDIVDQWKAKLFGPMQPALDKLRLRPRRPQLPGGLRSIPAPFTETFATEAGYLENFELKNYDHAVGFLVRPENVTHFTADGGYIKIRLIGVDQGGQAYPSGAEVVSYRGNFHFGRYRYLAKIPDTRSLPYPQGWVGALWIFESTYPGPRNEIDIEFTRWQGVTDTTDKVYFATHVPAGDFSVSASYDSSYFGALHWYEIDWKPTEISFLIDGVQVQTINGIGEVPQDTVRIYMSTWAGMAAFGGLSPAIGTEIFTEVHQVEYIPYTP